MGHCAVCLQNKKPLHAMSSRSAGDQQTHLCSHSPYAVRTTPRKRRTITTPPREIKEKCMESNVVVDKMLDSGIWTQDWEGRGAMVKKYPKDWFQWVFWEQHEKAAPMKNSHSIKCHPLFIKWCLYLRHLSGKPYNMMKKSKCIYLTS